MAPTPAHRPIAIAHRAANDLGRLRKAQAIGADYVECDIWRYQGRLEVRHEKTLGPLPIRWDRWKLEWKGPPRLVLEQLVEAWRGPAPLLLDLKGWDDAVPAHVLQVVGDASQQVQFAVTARTWRLLDPFAEIPGIAAFPSAGSDADIERLRTMGPKPNWTGIAVHRKLLTQERVAQLRELAPLVTTWPINSLEALVDVLGYGVDGVTSDNLDVIRYIVQSRQAVPGPE
jgi:glycerophosphoryl diester phosphodiesterase